MAKSVAAKMGIKPGGRALFVNAPVEVVEAMELPALAVQPMAEGSFDYIHLFVTSQQEMHQHFAGLKNHLIPTGMLWVSWPKAGQRGTDLTLTRVIEIGYTYGLVESQSISVDATWSALKFTHPKEGKTYNNSYGNLNL